MNPTHLPMAVWIHSSVRSFLSSTVRLKLSPVVPFTDDKKMLDHTEPTFVLSMHHSKASPLQFLAHLILHFLVPTARAAEPGALAPPPVLDLRMRTFCMNNWLLHSLSASPQPPPPQSYFCSAASAPRPGLFCPHSFKLHNTTGDDEGLGSRLLQKSLFEVMLQFMLSWYQCSFILK